MLEFQREKERESYLCHGQKDRFIYLYIYIFVYTHIWWVSMDFPLVQDFPWGWCKNTSGAGWGWRRWGPGMALGFRWCRFSLAIWDDWANCLARLGKGWNQKLGLGIHLKAPNWWMNKDPQFWKSTFQERLKRHKRFSRCNCWRNYQESKLDREAAPQNSKGSAPFYMCIHMQTTQTTHRKSTAA